MRKKESPEGAKGKEPALPKDALPKDAQEVMEIVNLPIEKVFPSGWNPNEQDEETFNELTADIKKDGFDEPIIVVEDDAALGTYKIISGEHRWRAMKVLGKTQIPAVVKKGWDEVAQKLKTVRRNLLRGRLNPTKFTKLINDIKRVYDVDHAKIASEMGFRDEKEYWRNYRQERVNRDEAAQGILTETRKELTMIDNLSVVLNEVFSQYGDTVPQSYIFFMHKKKMHLLVGMDGSLCSAVELLTGHMKETGKDANSVLTEAIHEQLKKLGVEIEPKTEEAEAGGGPPG